MSERNADRALRLLSRAVDPGWHVSSITAGSSGGTWGPDGYDETDSHHGQWYRQTLPDSWCVTVESDGWDEERDRVFAWGTTIAEAALRVAAYIRERRYHPHRIHIYDSEFVTGCAECVEEAERMFGNNVDWTAA